MKTLCFIILACCLLSVAHPQKAYRQQEVNYTIDVSLNDKQNTLDGFEKIVYTNHSTDTLTYIWFHLWPNAYKNDRTAFSDQLLENGNTKFYFSSKEQRGYINRLDFKVNGITAKTEDHPQYIDVVKIILPAPLLSSQQMTITTPFHVKLPFNFSRGGYDNHSYQISQWYPKPAVYDASGWHPMPYLDQGEFYSEFGSFDVRITVPKEYVVAATGLLQNEEEKVWLKQKQPVVESVKVQSSKFKSPRHSVQKNKKTDSEDSNRKSQIPNPKFSTAAETKTLQYQQDSVHDFAWFADKQFIVNYDTCWLPSGRVIDVYTYYTLSQQNIWKNSVALCKRAVRFYSDEVGEYPYNIVSAVQGPQSFGGGMEYPTITIISPMTSVKNLDITLAHEIGHNWFYGILGSNERAHPWMDEGINSFYEYKYAKRYYGDNNQVQELLFQTKAFRKTDQPVETPSEKFSANNYALVAYHKTAKWMQWLEQQLGEKQFQQVMKTYYQQWKFRHPQPQDLEAIFRQYAPLNTERAFTFLRTTGLLPNQHYNGWKIITPLQPKTISSYINNPGKNAFIFSPLIGINSYDKLMIGAGLTNYKLPPNNFQFLLVPLYATGSKQLTGLGKLNYTLYPNSSIRMIDIFINAAKFSMDRFTDSTGRTTYLQVKKFVPGFRLTFKEKDPRSTVKQFIQWKTYFINEGSFRFSSDTSFASPDTTITQHLSVDKNNSWLNQLSWTYENYRALYPFHLTAQIEQAKDFIKPTLTADYFFNYAKEGGLDVRLFAGKFFYLNGKTNQKSFNTERYQLNLTGPNGYEDYTYSDYFIGRNEYAGWRSQEIMVRDGAFKVRTDLLAGKIGKSDDWLTAVNFSSTIPAKFNPFSVLPFKIPLRLFADIGTYAGAWQPNAGIDRFLFDAGLHLPLLDGLINIYVPVAYSKVYGDYFKSTLGKNRFLKTISFSVNLNNATARRINRELEF